MKLSDNNVHKDEIGFTDSIIAAQAFSFFVGGYETSSITLSNALYEIARSSYISSQLRKEVDNAISTYGQLSYYALSSMTFLQQTIDEVLRLHSPVFYIQRKCTKDYQIPGTNIFVEKGVEVIIPVLELHTDPIYFQNPNEFDPSRFSVDNKRKIQHGAYIPFGNGPRKCIGLQFGMLEIKLTLATIISLFDISLPENEPQSLEHEKFSRVYRVKGKILIKFDKRRTIKEEST